MHGKKYVKNSDVYECFWASGSSLAIRCDLFRNLRGFNNYFAYFEDVDLSWRVRAAGYKIVCSHRSSVIHMQGGTATSELSLFYNERNRVVCYWQNLSVFLFLLCLPILLIVRICLLFYLVHNSKELAAKLKGLWAGLVSLINYPHFPSSLVIQLSTISRMYQVKKYDNNS